MNNNKLLILSFLVITALSVLSSFLITKYYEEKLEGKITQLEYAKAGGKEAYEVDIALRKALVNHPKNPQNLTAQKEFLKQLNNGELPADTHNNDGNTDNTPNEEVINNSEPLTQAMMDSILKTAVLENNSEDKDIVVIEYSDMECPFCARQHNQNDIKWNILKDYGDKVTYAFKNHRGVDHPGTEAKALWALCANKVGGKDLYVKFYEEVFKYSATTNGGYYPVDKLSDIIKNAGANVSEWQSCVDNKELLNQFLAETREAVKLWMGGTPSTLIFNKKTGKFDTIMGAYPYEEFKKAIERLSK